MAKDLPYFKFFCSEWSDGDITLESYETQGIFINICAYYWSNKCEVSYIKLKKKFRNVSENVFNELIESGSIKVEKERVIINFLNEQLVEREESSKIKSKGGKASAEARKLAKEQQELNKSSTEIQHVLKSCSTETQVLRREEKREEEKRKENIINNNEFSKNCKSSEQWKETTAMQNKIKPDAINFFLDNFENHLITMEEQKKTLKEFKEHFTHWLRKQDFSIFTQKIIGKSNQI